MCTANRSRSRTLQAKLEEIWANLEAAGTVAGLVKRLLDPDWPGELSAAMVKPDNSPAVILELANPVPIEIANLSKSEALDLRTLGNSGGVTAIQVTLADPKYRDVFGVLCADLCGRVLSTQSESDGARMLVNSLSRWLRFLRRRRFELLSPERQLGLYGELATLNDLIAPSVGYEHALRAWTGPLGSFQDFQHAEIALEVKTLSATQPQQLHIETERQLDDRGLTGLVVVHIAVDRRQGTGRSLPDLVECIRSGLEAEAASSEDFDDRLFEAGYLDAHAHLYGQTGYTERGVHLYRVGTGFPRIVEDDLRPGLGSVRYLIDASACVPFEVEPERVAAWLKDNGAPFDPVTGQESQHLEFKASAWKSQDPAVPDKVINESIVKSVAALLNSDGGALVIGVEDRTNAVLGIDPDLRHLGVDLDTYENRLTTLFVTALGSAATTRVRLEFKPREGQTVCVVTVRPSPRPVFAHSPVARDKRNRFWVRINNTTRELEGQDLVDYIRDHWG
jgi:hypothetical protein